jgi:ABC-type transport system involved in cytochrome bd biosynthesis fused ATPase/permease subunit
MKIVWSGLLIRHPLGGHSWQHLQYLVGLRCLGHKVTYFENYGWPNSSCCAPARDDIACASPGAKEEEIVEAAKAANAHEFIVGLPHGYESRVGERGASLSGGERQRVALARAFLKDAPILILDEPTSSVDTKTEAAIMEAMERLMRGRTTFMIAHRLATLANCDARLEVEDGRVVKFEQQRIPAENTSKNMTEPLPRSMETHE